MMDNGWEPHGYCFLWDPFILSTMVVSDAVIAVSYIIIATCLLLILKYVRISGLLVTVSESVKTIIIISFAAFIFTCAMTHLIAIYTLWEPAYLYQSLICDICALISFLTAIFVVITTVGILKKFSHE